MNGTLVKQNYPHQVDPGSSMAHLLGSTGWTYLPSHEDVKVKLAISNPDNGKGKVGEPFGYSCFSAFMCDKM